MSARGSPPLRAVAARVLGRLLERSAGGELHRQAARARGARRTAGGGARRDHDARPISPSSRWCHRTTPHRALAALGGVAGVRAAVGIAHGLAVRHRQRHVGVDDAAARAPIGRPRRCASSAPTSRPRPTPSDVAGARPGGLDAAALHRRRRRYARRRRRMPARPRSTTTAVPTNPDHCVISIKRLDLSDPAQRTVPANANPTLADFYATTPSGFADPLDAPGGSG